MNADECEAEVERLLDWGHGLTYDQVSRRVQKAQVLATLAVAKRAAEQTERFTDHVWSD